MIWLRFLNWLLGRDVRHSKGDPDTCPICRAALTKAKP